MVIVVVVVVIGVGVVVGSGMTAVVDMVSMVGS